MHRRTQQQETQQAIRRREGGAPVAGGQDHERPDDQGRGEEGKPDRVEAQAVKARLPSAQQH